MSKNKFLFVHLAILLIFGVFSLKAQSLIPPQVPNSIAQHLEVAEASKLQASIPEQPQVALRYYWDHDLQVWGDTNLRMIHTYQGGIETPKTTILSIKINGAWETKQRIERDFDQAGRLTLYKRDEYSNGNWVPNFKHVYTYDAQGNREMAIYLGILGMSGFDTTGIEFYINTYDASDNLLDVIINAKYYGDLAFSYYSNETYTYNSNNEIATYSFKYWNGQAWEISWMNRGYVWRDYAKRQAMEYKQDFYNLSPNIGDSLWIVNTWDVNDSYTENSLGYDLLTNSWDTIRKKVYRFDAHGHRELTERIIWIDSSNVWELERGDQYINFHNSDDHLSAYHEQYFDDTSQSYLNSRRWEFYDFNVGIDQAMEEIRSVTWAPHPTGQEGNLLVESDRSGKMKVKIMDLTGRILRQFERGQIAGLKEHRLEMNLPAGLYLYHLTIDGNTKAGRLVIGK